jgi:hypothetical protein
MNFNLHNINYTCTQMYDKNTKELLAYSCSTNLNRKIEHFENKILIWDANTRYFVNNTVIYNGRQYIVKDQIYGDGTPLKLTPDTNSHIWTDQGPSLQTRPPTLAPIAGLPIWDSDKTYYGGDVVVYNGIKYIVKNISNNEGVPLGVPPNVNTNIWADRGPIIIPAPTTVPPTITINPPI